MIKLDFNSPPISIEDWEGYDENDLDQRYSYFIYFGLTYDKFLENLKTQSIAERCFELSYLPKIPFKFYSLFFISFFCSDDFNLDDLRFQYVIEDFFDILICKAENNRFLTDIWFDLKKLLNLVKIDKKYSLYEEDNYQDLMNKINTLEILKKQEDES